MKQSYYGYVQVMTIVREIQYRMFIKSIDNVIKLSGYIYKTVPLRIIRVLNWILL